MITCNLLNKYFSFKVYFEFIPCDHVVIEDRLQSAITNLEWLDNFFNPFLNCIWEDTII